MDDVAGGDGGAGVDFSDEEKAVAWLEKQSGEVRFAIASRAALRVCGSISQISQDRLPKHAIGVLRAILTSALRGFGRAEYIDHIAAASFAHSSASSTTRDTDYTAAFAAGV